MAEAKQELQVVSGPREGSLKWFLEQPGYKNRFNQLLGERAPQFVASLINIAGSQKAFEKVAPPSIIAAGAVAATLDLPIDKNFGFAWIIPYGGVAQFQIGYKGWVQLALRSGRYSGMNAVCVNAEALGGYDDIGDPLIKWEKLDETKPAVGYAFAWRLTTGFTKIVYWPKEKVEAHAKRYSQAYKAGKKDSPWFSDFDKMALKTLVTNAIRRWGIVSVDDRMQQALSRDQSAAIDIDAEPFYPDNDAYPKDITDGFTDEDEHGERPTADFAERLASQLRSQRVENGVSAKTARGVIEEQENLREPGDESEQEDQGEEEETAQPAAAAATSKPSSATADEKRSTLVGLFESVAKLHGHDVAAQRLELSAGKTDPAKVKAEKLDAGIDEMLRLKELKPRK